MLQKYPATHAHITIYLKHSQSVSPFQSISKIVLRLRSKFHSWNLLGSRYTSSSSGASWPELMYVHVHLSKLISSYCVNNLMHSTVYAQYSLFEQTMQIINEKRLISCRDKLSSFNDHFLSHQRILFKQSYRLEWNKKH